MIDVEKNDFIIENYRKMPVKEMAKILGCSECSIKNIALRRGVTRYQKHAWTEEEDKTIAKMYVRGDSACFARMAKVLNVPRKVVSRRKDYLTQKYGKDWAEKLKPLSYPFP